MPKLSARGVGIPVALRFIISNVVAEYVDAISVVQMRLACTTQDGLSHVR